jgi:acetyl-CoA C-acetyltransferase
MDKVYLLGGRRSYIGVENGIYRNVGAEELGAFVIKKVMDSYGVSPEDIDLVAVGNAIGAGGNIGRLASLMAGVPEKTPVVTVDSQCGSGLAAIMQAAMQIELGMADVAIAGGFESSSTAPVRSINKRHPDFSDDGDNVFKVAKFKPGPYDELAMFKGAEKCAATFGMDRHELDMYAIRSHRRAAQARENGELDDILAGSFYEYDRSRRAVEDDEPGKCENAEAEQPKNRTLTRKEHPEKDEGIRDRISEKLLTRLPALVPGGSYITAGNVCLTNDGAAFVLLCSERFLKKYKENKKYIKDMNEIIHPFKIVDIVSVGASPDMSPVSIVPAIDKLLSRNNLKASDILAWEYNEAFAVIDKLMESYVNKDFSNANVFGGALAYGHPYGASGGIITLHLMKAMEKLMAEEAEVSANNSVDNEAGYNDVDNKDWNIVVKGEDVSETDVSETRYGVCAVAAAGGIGTAMLISR